MHTVRNRVASRPRPPITHAGAKVAKSKTRKPRCKEPAFLLRTAHPPAFPAHLIVPPPRGAVISTMPWPEAPKQKAQTAPKKPQKAATRRKTAPKAKGGAGKKPRKTTAKHTPPPATAAKEAPAPMTTIDLLDRALAIQPESHPSSPPPSPAPCNASPEAGGVPLPRSRAPAQVRGSGLIDAIGDWLRHVANRLGRWRGGRRNAGSDRAASVHAAARQRALQAQFEALEALREMAKAEDAASN